MPDCVNIGQPWKMKDGRVVCKLHGSTFCEECKLDFGMIDEVLELDGRRLGSRARSNHG